VVRATLTGAPAALQDRLAGGRNRPDSLGQTSVAIEPPAAIVRADFVAAIDRSGAARGASQNAR